MANSRRASSRGSREPAAPAGHRPSPGRHRSSARPAPAAPAGARPRAAAHRWPSARRGWGLVERVNDGVEAASSAAGPSTGCSSQQPVRQLVQARDVTLGGQLQRRGQQLILGSEPVGRGGQRQLRHLGHAAVGDRVGADLGDDRQHGLEQRLAAGGAAGAFLGLCGGGHPPNGTNVPIELVNALKGASRLTRSTGGARHPSQTRRSHRTSNPADRQGETSARQPAKSPRRVRAPGVRRLTPGSFRERGRDEAPAGRATPTNSSPGRCRATARVRNACPNTAEKVLLTPRAPRGAVGSPRLSGWSGAYVASSCASLAGVSLGPSG